MNDQVKPPVDPLLDLRRTLGCFPTGVTVVSCLGRSGQPLGLTVSSFNSVSLDPPLILWSLQNRSIHLEDYLAADRFAVNVLCAEQSDACRIFASDVEDRFADIDWHMSANGLPIPIAVRRRWSANATVSIRPVTIRSSLAAFLPMAAVTGLP